MFTRKEVSDIPFTSEAWTMEGNPHSVYLRSFGPRSGYGAGSGHAQHHSRAGCFGESVTPFNLLVVTELLSTYVGCGLCGRGNGRNLEDKARGGQEARTEAAFTSSASATQPCPALNVPGQVRRKEKPKGEQPTCSWPLSPCHGTGLRSQGGPC